VESQFYKLDRLSKRATVFLSYARAGNPGGWITAFIAEHRQFSGGRSLSGFLDQHDIRSLDDWQHRILGWLV
jgi:hypothetical protein